MEELMPFALKGIDLAVFSVFRSLGLKVIVRPMLDDGHIVWSGIDEEERGSNLPRIGDAFHGLQICDDETYDGDDEANVRRMSYILNI